MGFFGDSEEKEEKMNPKDAEAWINKGTSLGI